MAALQNLNKNDKQSFQEMASAYKNKKLEELVERQLSSETRKSMEKNTPDAVKNLKPSNAPQGCYPYWLPDSVCFCAYYPNKDPSLKANCTTSSYKGQKTHQQALQTCVNFIYKHYRDQGGEPKPC